MKQLLPIFLVGITCVAIPGMSGSAEPTQAPVDTSIRFATLDEAITSLRAKKSVTFRNQNGWMVADDLEAFTVWLLTPVGHPAYPSMVRRTLVNKGDGAFFDTTIRCLASKEACDEFFGSK